MSFDELENAAGGECNNTTGRELVTSFVSLGVACAVEAAVSAGTGLYAAVFNLSDEERTVEITPEELEVPVVGAAELWTGARTTRLSAELKPHACAVWLAETGR